MTSDYALSEAPRLRPLPSRAANRESISALADALKLLEAKLVENEDWRALKQLEAREAAGEWFDVIEGDVLRQRLTQAVAASAEFMAWQFIEAAMGCLDARERALNAVFPAHLGVDSIEAGSGNARAVEAAATPLSSLEVVPPAAGPTVTPLVPVLEMQVSDVSMPDVPVADAPMLTAPACAATGHAGTGGHSDGARPVAMPDLDAEGRAGQTPARALARRIPTLYAHGTKTFADVATGSRLEAPSGADRTVGSEVTIVTLVPSSGAAAAVPAADLPTAQNSEDGLFEPVGEPSPPFAVGLAGITEADVQIVTREPARTLIDPRLPPSPLLERTRQPGWRLPRASRAASLKWAEPDDRATRDFRPVASALDEAQVAIIDTTARSEAQARAERRALGIAPDREREMQRFLQALSGE